jgi:hypothetical protein
LGNGGIGQAAHLCQMSGCTSSKARGSYFCSNDHEQKHCTAVAKREGLSALCTRYIGGGTHGAFRCITCEYRPSNHCCAAW